MQTFNKHIIQEGEKLADIEELYNIPKHDIVIFHNKHTRFENHIFLDISHQKELALPRNAVLNKNKLVQFSSGNTLGFRPKNSFYKYGIVINIENGEKHNELKYEASVRWIKTESNLQYFEVDRISKIYLNQEEVNEIADLLAYKSSKVLFPLQISVDKTGKYFAVENFEVFQKRWNGVKEEIYKEFEGELVDNYLHKMEEIVVNQPELITMLLEKDYFLRTLFFGVNVDYGKTYECKIENTFPVVGNVMEPNFSLTLEIDPVLDDYGLINIEGSGTLNDERSKEDIINGSPFSFIIEEKPVMNEEGKIRLQYYLNSKTGMPESVYLESSIMLAEQRKISVSVSKIE